MRLRLWISMVATMGVLLHAGFLVRHSLAMADATQAYHAILTDLATLCRAGPGVVRVPVSDLPSLPQPPDPAGCPVCAGRRSLRHHWRPLRPVVVPVATAAATELFRRPCCGGPIAACGASTGQRPAPSRLIADRPRQYAPARLANS